MGFELRTSFSQGRHFNIAHASEDIFNNQKYRDLLIYSYMSVRIYTRPGKFIYVGQRKETNALSLY
jgi:hypothetical protein